MAYIPGDKIGEYVHYKYENYMRYGLARKLSTVNKPQRSLSIFLHQARQESIALSRRLSHEQVTKSLEQQLTYLMGKGKDNGELQTPEITAIKNTIVQYLSSICKTLTAEDIDLSTLTLTASGRQKILSINLDYSKLSAVFGEKTLAIETLRKVAIGRGVTRQINLKQFSNRIQQTYTAIGLINAPALNIQTLQNRVKSIAKRAGISNIESVASGRIATESLADDLRQVAKEAFGYAALQFVEGLLAESFVAAVGEQLGATLGKGYKQVISELVGSSQGQNVFIENKFMSGLNMDKIMTNSRFQRSQDGITWETTNSPQGKTDVKLTLDNTILRASVKNYDFTNRNPHIKGVTLVNGTNLLFLMSNKSDFLNHYLNQTVDTAPANIITAANEIMRTMIILMSLTGGGTRRENNQLTILNKANVFIINDKSRPGYIKVISMEDIFHKILQIPGFQSQVQVSLKTNQSWNNSFIGDLNIMDPWSANARITNILAQVRAYKIKSSIPFGLMSQLIKS